MKVADQVGTLKRLQVVHHCRCSRNMNKSGCLCVNLAGFVPTNSVPLPVGRDASFENLPRWRLIMASFFTSLLRDYRRPLKGRGFYHKALSKAAL